MGNKNTTPAKEIVRYLCPRTMVPMVVDGNLKEPSWAQAVRSSRFSDHTGARALFDTQASLVWDDRYLYVGFWLEDRDIQANQRTTSHKVRLDSHVGVIFTGPGVYYDLVVNPLGVTSEIFYVWKDTYRQDERFDVEEFDLKIHHPEVMGGGSRTEYNAMRWAFLDWCFPGLQVGVRIEGDPNQRSCIDQGWSVELAFPWEGFKWLSSGETLAPSPGDIRDFGLIRRQTIDQRGQQWQATWTWQPLALNDGRMPETNLELELCG